MAERTIKVTDKRMFTPEGELREEFRFLEEAEAPEPSAEPNAESVTEPTEPEASPEAAAPAEPAAPEPTPESAAQAEPPPSKPAPPGFDELPGAGPRFFDLVAAIAEPASVYLGDQPLPGGQSAENLDMARLYIDLLDVLRQSTAGNLPAQESAFLEDALYQLRVRYVQKRG